MSSVARERKKEVLTKKKLLGVACLSITVMFALSGCGEVVGGPEKSADSTALEIPDSNPWKKEISEAFESTTNSFVRQVLADGVITDAEGAEAYSKYEKCLADIGVKVVSEGIGGAEETSPLDGKPMDKNPGELIQKCRESTGYEIVGALYKITKDNPNNVDPVEFMLKCLQDRGVVEKDVKLEQFRENYEDWDYMNEHREDFDACDAQPKV